LNLRNHDGFVRVNQTAAGCQVGPDRGGMSSRGPSGHAVGVPGRDVASGRHHNAAHLCGRQSGAGLLDQRGDPGQLWRSRGRAAERSPTIAVGRLVPVRMRAAGVAGIDVIARLEREHQVNGLRLHADQAAQIWALTARIDLAEKAARIVRSLERLVGVHEHTAGGDHIRVLTGEAGVAVAG